LVVLLLLGLLVSACAAPAAPPAPAAAPAATEAPKAAAPAATEAPTAAPKATEAPAAAAPGKGSLAVVLTGPWQDHSWNEAGYAATQALGKQGVKVAYSENVSDADAARVLRQYCDQGYQMIIAHSFSFQDATFQVAKECPQANFAWAGGIQKMAKNVADYDQPFYEAAYPIGVIAGHMSKSGVLGALYGNDIPVCHAMGEALLAGAKTVNPNAKLVTTVVGDWVDVAKAKEAALAQADAGVDYWIECGEGPALGAIEAAKERGGYVTGYVGDMTESGPSVVLVNLYWNLEPLFSKMLAQTTDKSFNAPWYRYGIAEGAMQLKYNDALKSKIPAEAIKAADQAMADIKDGKLKVEFVPQASK
jgi:simple sugar transport system substrate-binding protein/basic membrane protein A